MSTLGERIKVSRENQGLYQSQLAELIGVKSAAVISNWEKDINKPDAEKIVRLCEALNISASFLLDYAGSHVPTEKSPIPDESETGDKYRAELLECYDSMNPAGQTELVKHARLLINAPEYKKCAASDSVKGNLIA